jgi:protein ImuB
VVAACSRAATRCGVRPGQFLAEAQACLSESASAAVYLPADSAGDLEQLRTLAHEAQRFTPLVGLKSAPASDALLLDITGCAHLFGGESGLCHALQSWLTECGYHIRWTLADTVGAAWACARFGRQSMIVPPGKHVALLRSFPLAALRLPEATVAALHTVGLQTVGDMAVLPRESLPSRFGPELLRRWDQACGELPEMFPVERLKEPIVAVREFEEPLTHRLAVDAVSDAVLETLLALPRLLAAGPQELRGTFRLEHDAVTIDLRLIEPTRDARHLGQLARLQLDRVTWLGGVFHIRWEVLQAGPLPIQQTEFFETDRTENCQRSLSQLVDRLASRLGHERVLRVRSVPDAQPEFAATCEPWQSPVPSPPSAGERVRVRGTSVSRGLPIRTGLLSEPRSLIPAFTNVSPPHPNPLPHRNEGEGTGVPCRPTRLLRSPQRLDVWSVVPDGPPFRVTWRGRTHEITRAWGPERIETGWWRAPDVKRDYYRVEVASGAQWWLFRERASGNWFLQGFFE